MLNVWNCHFQALEVLSVKMNLMQRLNKKAVCLHLLSKALENRHAFNKLVRYNEHFLLNCKSTIDGLLLD